MTITENHCPFFIFCVFPLFLMPDFFDLSVFFALRCQLEKQSRNRTKTRKNIGIDKPMFRMTFLPFGGEVRRGPSFFFFLIGRFAAWDWKEKIKIVKIGLKIAQIAYLAALGGGFLKTQPPLAVISPHVISCFLHKCLAIRDYFHTFVASLSHRKPFYGWVE